MLVNGLILFGIAFAVRLVAEVVLPKGWIERIDAPSSAVDATKTVASSAAYGAFFGAVLGLLGENPVLGMAAVAAVGYAGFGCGAVIAGYVRGRPSRPRTARV